MSRFNHYTPNSEHDKENVAHYMYMLYYTIDLTFGNTI